MGWLLALALLALAVAVSVVVIRRVRHAWDPERCKTEGHVDRHWRRRYWREPMGAWERFNAVLYEVTEKRLRCRRCQEWLEPTWEVERQESVQSVTWPQKYWDQLRQHEAGVRITFEGWV